MRMAIAAAVLLAAAALAGLGDYYYRVGQELDDIRGRLVTEAQLAQPDEPATTSGIRLAPIQCARVYDLRANPIARRLRGDEIRGHVGPLREDRRHGLGARQDGEKTAAVIRRAMAQVPSVQGNRS